MAKLSEYFIVRARREWRRQLIELLKEGVAIRNDGRSAIKTRQQAAAWARAADDWKTRVFSEIKRLDENAAEDYELLDVVPPPRLPITTRIRRHAHAYQMLDYRVFKLRGLIKDTQT
jgi:hypothetical protein